MEIQSNSKVYNVYIKDTFDFTDDFINEKNTLFVVDQKIYNYYPELFNNISENQLYLISVSENIKTIETVLEICSIMTEIPAKRNAHLISIGGGIIQDITGFVANILYRGIQWTFIPTTLLAACDSCIGGKTSLNYKSYKNLLGTFYPPDDIYICPSFFTTLNDKDYLSGLGEVVKFNLMFGKDGLLKLEKDLNLLLRQDKNKLKEYVENSLLFKKKYIEEDEFDKGIRINLNFAHTFGHAFETISKYAIPHGTAVAMGMVVANRVSYKRGWLDTDSVERMEKILFQIIDFDMSSISIDIKEIIAAIRKDKKQVSTDLTAVLMYDNMKLRIVHDLKPNETETAIQYTYNKLKLKKNGEKYK